MADTHHPRRCSLPARSRTPSRASRLRRAAARGLGRPRRPQLHQGRTRRHAVVPLVVPDGYLRQLRHDGQRRTEADLRDLPRRIRAGADPRRAAGQFPVHPRPGRRHRRLHRQARAGQAVARSGSEKPVAEGEYLQTPAQLDELQAVQHVHQLHALLLRPARCTGSTTSSSARRRSRSRSATTSTPATRARADAAGRPVQPEGVWECTFVGECSECARSTSIPPGAIQQAKLTAAMDTLKSYLLPRGRR